MVVRNDVHRVNIVSEWQINPWNPRPDEYYLALGPLGRGAGGQATLPRGLSKFQLILTLFQGWTHWHLLSLTVRSLKALNSKLTYSESFCTFSMMLGGLM